MKSPTFMENIYMKYLSFVGLEYMMLFFFPNIFQ